jgi:ActR/RegA family two-component response regulator
MSSGDAMRDGQFVSLELAEWIHIQKALQYCHGNVSAAARVLKVHRSTLRRKLIKNSYGRTYLEIKTRPNNQNPTMG